LKSKEMDTLTMIVVTNPGDFQPEQFLTNKEVKAANDPIMVYKK
jgi:PTS system glucose-specific IIA component